MLPKIHLSIERWKKNTEYGVWVSNQGNIKLIKNRENLNPRINESGYCMVFTELGVISVHRLVAYTWLGGKRNAKYDIDHINSNKRDNSVRNLRWVTKEINLEYAAYTQCKSLKETRPQTSAEEDEDIMSILFNTTLLDEQRVAEFKTVLNEKKIELKCGGKVVANYDELVALKNKKASTAMEMDKFMKRVLTAANTRCVYCGHLWKIKVI